MRVDSLTLVRFVLKPVLFAGCLAPAAVLAARIAGLFGLGFGPNPVEDILHTLGKTGLNLLLLTLLVTPLRQWTGWTQLIRLRRMLGLYAFFYVLLHFLFYVVVDRRLDWATVVEDVGKRPYITLGFAGLLLLVPLALTSTQRAMRALGRRWQRLHRLVYVVALLGCVHYYWQVKADIRLPAVYFAMLFALLGWRWWKQRARMATLAA
jgi:sulfoxide reductase heme-binding subunit YedZ